jgi:hypothetical protein
MRNIPLLSRIEALEPRIAPASVSATLTNGTLKLSALAPGAAVNAILVQLDADTFNLHDGAPTPLVFDGVRNVQATLSDVTDNFSIILPFSASRVPFTVNSGLGNDQITFDGSGGTWGDVSVTGLGTASVSFLSGVSARGHVTINTVGGALLSSGTLGDLTLAGAAFTQLSGFIAGNAKVIASDVGLTFNANGIIHGSLTVLGGAGVDAVNLSGLTSGKIRFAGGAGPAAFNASGNFSAGSSVTVIGSDAPDTVNIGFTSPDIFVSAIRGPLTLALGGGDNNVAIAASGRMSSYLRVTTGDQNDTVNVGSFFTIGGALQLALGAGNNSSTLTGLHVAGGLKFAGVAGNDSLTIQNTSILNTPRIVLGDGGNSFSATNATFENGLYVKGGAANDTVNFGGVNVYGKATVALGNGANQWNVIFGGLRGGFSYLGGIDNDTVTLDPNVVLAGVGSMKGGLGNNVLNVQNLSFLSALSYIGDVGADLFVINSSTAAFARIKASLGDGADLAVVTTAAFVSLRVDGGAGADTIQRIAAAVDAGLIALNFETTTSL